MNKNEYWDGCYTNLIDDKEKGIVRYNTPKLKAIISHMLPKKVVGSVFEVGCGFGLFAYCMKYKDYFGIDLSQEAIDIAKGYGLNVDKCDIHRYYSAKTYDNIMFFDSFEHILGLDDLAFKVMDFCHMDTRIFINIPLSMSYHNTDYDYHVREDNVARFFSLMGIEGYIKSDIDEPVNDRKYQLYEGVYKGVKNEEGINSIT